MSRGGHAVRSQRAQPAPGVRDQIRFGKILPFVMSQKADFQIGASRMHFRKSGVELKRLKMDFSSFLRSSLTSRGNRLLLDAHLAQHGVFKKQINRL